MKDLKSRPLSLEDFFKDEATSMLLPLDTTSAADTTEGASEEFHDAPDSDLP